MARGARLETSLTETVPLRAVINVYAINPRTTRSSYYTVQLLAERSLNANDQRHKRRLRGTHPRNQDVGIVSLHFD